MSNPPKARHPRYTTPQADRQYVDLEGQTKKVDDSVGNDTDVNNIVARFQRTGEELPENANATFDDVSDINDLADIIIKGKTAEDRYAALKAEQADKKAKQQKSDAEELARLREAAKASSASENKTLDEVTNP